MHYKNWLCFNLIALLEWQQTPTAFTRLCHTISDALLNSCNSNLAIWDFGVSIKLDLYLNV
ncbi:hypothetical protein T10_11253 [Trichinella papuae]|uniref:Uncharacterized protein n=1 Tax=Trichinella papuae TaxID=268474 RepID=A0A0V1N630_9BILA|nr:hypothetical protein T10_11253 [Trichinella papuae]